MLRHGQWRSTSDILTRIGRKACVELYSRRHEAAICSAKRLIALAPNFAEGHEILGYALHYSGKPEDALGCFDRAMALNPYYPDVYLHFQAQAMFQLRRYEVAIGVPEAATYS